MRKYIYLNALRDVRERERESKSERWSWIVCMEKIKQSQKDRKCPNIEISSTIQANNYEIILHINISWIICMRSQWIFRDLFRDKNFKYIYLQKRERKKLHRLISRTKITNIKWWLFCFVVAFYIKSDATSSSLIYSLLFDCLIQNV